jgi:hypothetical protein
MNRTIEQIRIEAAELENTVATEYPEAPFEDALYESALNKKHLGWSQEEVDLLLGELGF